MRLLAQRLDDDFSTKENVVEKIKNLQSLVKNTYVSQLSWTKWLEGHTRREQELTQLVAKQKTQLDQHKESLDDLYELTKAKANRLELDKFRGDLQRYCLYEDLKELHAKVLPPINQF